MANEIERRYGSKGLHALSLHPGSITTGLQVHMDERQNEIMKIPEVLAYNKSVEQGAATQVYAAISKDWEGKGGKFLSNCEEMGPDGEGEGVHVKLPNTEMRIGDDGYAPYAFEPENEARLWKESLALVGMIDDD